MNFFRWFGSKKATSEEGHDKVPQQTVLTSDQQSSTTGAEDNKSISVPVKDIEVNPAVAASISSSESSNGSLDLDNCAAAKQKWIDTLRYTARFQESQLKGNGVSFVKPYEDEEDWKGNHFLMKSHGKGKEGSSTQGVDYGVIFSSYHLDEVTQKLDPNSIAAPFYVSNGFKAQGNDGQKTDNTSLGNSQSQPPYWFRFAKPSTKSLPKTPGDDSPVWEFLEHLKKEQPEVYGDYDLNDIPAKMPFYDLPEDLKGTKDPKSKQKAEVTCDFLESALKYWSTKACEEIYQKLFGWSRADRETAELVLGLGHVRMVYTDKKEETKIVNGPLIEIVMEVKLQEEDDSLLVHPRKDVQPRVNGEVLTVLRCGGVGALKNIVEIHQKAEKKDLNKLFPGDPSSFHDIVKKASNLRWNGVLRLPSAHDVHELPNDERASVFTEAFCLYGRKKLSHFYARDSYALAEAVENGKLSISRGIYAMVEGPEALDKIDSEINASVAAMETQVNDIVFPLPATEKQRKIAHDLFVKTLPVVSVDGPPGTGKTHSIVNFVAAALARGLNIVVASSNSRALQALVEKLPFELRTLCADFSSCEEADTTGLLNALENMLTFLHDNNYDEEKIKEYEDQIQKLKTEQKALDQILKTESEASRHLVEQDDVKRFLVLATKMPSWSVRCAFTLNNFDIRGIIQEEDVTSKGITFDFPDEDLIALLELVEKKKQQESISEQTPNDSVEGTSRRKTSTFEFKSTSSESDSLVSKLKVDGRSPITKEDWHRILCLIQSKKSTEKCLQDLCEQGCRKADIYDQKKDIKIEFLDLLQKAKELKGFWDGLASDDDRKALWKRVFLPLQGKALQSKRRRLVADIQSLETSLVFSKVIVGLNKKLSFKAHGKLVELSQTIAKAQANALSSDGNKNSVRALRNAAELRKSFKETAKYLPFLVATTDQCSKFFEADHVFDLGILDEASQSDCTALNIFARCKQMLVVGDDKQVSPSWNSSENERIRELEVCLPDIESKSKLLPGSSFFDLIKVAYPSYTVILSEHFRCDPAIIAPSNNIFYAGRLKPLRLPSKERAITFIRVEGKKEKTNNKTINRAEAELIATLVHDEIEKAARGEGPVQTIGIISLGGDDQVELIKECVDNRVDPLRLLYGSVTVDRHEILEGVPKQFQGGERDIVYLSLVHSASDVGQAEQKEDDRKKWNVALTRAKNKMVIVCSYDKKDLKKKADIRRRVFDEILDSGNVSEPKMIQVRSSSTIQTNVEDRLISDLKDCGFDVRPKGGQVWGNAICISHQEKCNSASALVCVENAGENEKAWQTMFEEQVSLERAGRACLRVDCLSLGLNYDASLQEVLEFLAEAGLSVPAKLKDVPSNAQATDSSKSSATFFVPDAERKQPAITNAKRKAMNISDAPSANLKAAPAISAPSKAATISSSPVAYLRSAPMDAHIEATPTSSATVNAHNNASPSANLKPAPINADSRGGAISVGASTKRKASSAAELPSAKRSATNAAASPISENMTNNQLYEECKRRGIKGNAKRKKKEWFLEQLQVGSSAAKRKTPSIVDSDDDDE